ncbi:patatin-like phospholipase family protein [Halanaerobium sp. Z-7514]|uniref:Patatin-like phospholipase family protein n=1 Tax=Halanaerobium polyolivorans TaxID=2886943 RepID=A0AAW4WVP2_9FIRM|nr:patatin-like phospholipase family protein [Halanaerobium polyolivorans]MCC3144620.1 patatin-like phospholipase family protein [Halanaerobium polyolivorans]
MRKKKIGIVLAGGGARGFAHLGVLKALEEKGIRADLISAVSAGSIVGAFIAAGKKPEEIMEIMKENDFFDYAKVTLPINGLMSLDNLNKNLEEHLEAEKISELKIPLYIAASNLVTGKIKYFKEGDLSKIVQASSSIPVLFSPVEIEGDLYVDGGLLDNLPVEPLKDQSDLIIAINIMPIEKTRKLDNLVEIAVRTFQLSVNRDQEKIKNAVDLFIEPEGLEEYHILDTKHADKLFDLGYKHTRKMDINF